MKFDETTWDAENFDVDLGDVSGLIALMLLTPNRLEEPNVLPNKLTNILKACKKILN